MARLIIRNVGPIKDIDIELNKVNVFIGEQSSGISARGSNFHKRRLTNEYSKNIKHKN